MLEKKVGIITQYYKSHNYGGLLQAYALAVALKNLGYNVEQIAYDSANDDFLDIWGVERAVSQTCGLKSRIKMVARKMLDYSLHIGLNKRFQAMECFGQDIPHSDIVYDKESVSKLCDVYTQFVVGSDQVWNPQFYAPIYFCDFARGTDTVCISYAASVSQNQLTEKQAEIYKKHMKNFSAISLRESNTEIIQELTDTKVEWVLDPTLLLSREEWDEICAQRLIEESYVFCYFLGNDSIERRLAKEFAKMKKCKLVTIPHLSGMFDKADFGFGDKKMISAGPKEFISLIKYADYVFTDSFHATVFSHIYNKQFFVFQRAGKQGMSTRIETLVSLFGTRKYFCDTCDRQTTAYLLDNCDSRSDLDISKFEKKKQESLAFIEDKLI